MKNYFKNVKTKSTIDVKLISKNFKSLKCQTKLGKCFLLLFFLCSSTIGLLAQDVIIKKDGTEIQAKVTEIGTNEVKYIRYGTTSPTYVFLKSEIFMIKYEDGSKDVFNEENTQQKAQTEQKAGFNNTLSSNSNPVTYKYTFGVPINPNGGRKSAWGSGIASFFIPGLGQFINGDIGGGFLHLGLNVMSKYLMLSAIEIDSDGSIYIIDEMKYYASFVGAIAVNLISIVDAAQVAKKVNIVRGYQIANNTYLQIQPTIIPHNNLFAKKDYAYGMNLKVNF